jgi:hypothetical protein
VQLDIILTGLLGLLFSLMSPKDEHDKPLFNRKTFRLSFLYMLISGIGVAVGAYIIEPAWMLMYWINPVCIPLSHIIFLFALIYPGSFLLGYLVAPHLDAAGWGWRVLSVLIGYEVIFVIMNLTSRLWKVASFENFAQGNTVPLVSFSPLSFTPLAIELTIGLGVAVSSGIALLLYLRKLSK